MKKKFRLEAVVSAITGYLLCPIGDVYDVLNFLTGDNLFTHQLPRAGKVCRMPVFKQHPFLKEIDCSGVTRENWADKVAELKSKYPHIIELQAIENWTHIDPTQEAVDMIGGDKTKVIAINP